MLAADDLGSVGTAIWLAIVVLLLLLLRSQRAQALPSIPHNADSLPFFGDIFQVVRNFERGLDFVIELHDNLGHTYSWARPFGQRGINTSSIRNAEYMLKTNFDNFPKGEGFRELVTDILGRGIFAVDGAEWREKRKVASHMFSLKVLRDDMVTIFARHATALLEKMDSSNATASSAASASPVVFDIQELFFRFTLDSICEVAFGQFPDSLHNPDQSFPRAFDRAQYLITMRAWTLRVLWRLKRALNIGTEAELRDMASQVRRYCEQMVDARLQEQETAVRHYPDLLSRFITQARENGTELSRDQLRDVVLNFLVAGRDTTACLMSWATYELTRHTEEEEKLLQEIREIKAQSKSRSGPIWTPSYEDCNGMRYMDVFLREVLRLHPSVPQVAKFAVNDCVLPDGQFPLPAGSMCVISLYTMGRDKGLFGDDALQFRPSRWLDPARPLPSLNEFPVFNNGPRTCLGQHVAILEAKVMLAALLDRFIVRSHHVEIPGRPVYQMSITMSLRGGLPVSVSRRSPL